jgi:L-fucose isomerase-like protein
MREVYHEAEKFLALKQITIKVKKELVINAFLLAKVFEDLMKKYGAKIITIGQCASVVLPVSETTSCLALSILNNRGYTACCEGDMATLPAMLVLQRISNQPVFMNDPTIPHEGIVTVAHCTAPILMDGQTIEPSEIVPHFETGLGAAVRVNMPQKEVTIIDPDFKNKKWIIFTGQIIETPKLPICRTQLEIKIQGDWQKLLKEMCGFHWVLTYGNHLSELKRVAKLIGIRLVVI